MARDFSKLRIKNKEVEISGEKFLISGLSFPEVAEFSEYTDKKDNKGALRYLLKTTLRKAITQEEMNDEQLNTFIDELSADASTQIISTVTELSGLNKAGDSEKK